MKGKQRLLTISYKDDITNEETSQTDSCSFWRMRQAPDHRFSQEMETGSMVTSQGLLVWHS